MIKRNPKKSIAIWAGYSLLSVLCCLGIMGANCGGGSGAKEGEEEVKGPETPSVDCSTLLNAADCEKPETGCTFYKNRQGNANKDFCGPKKTGVTTCEALSGNALACDATGYVVDATGTVASCGFLKKEIGSAEKGCYTLKSSCGEIAGNQAVCSVEGILTNGGNCAWDALGGDKKTGICAEPELVCSKLSQADCGTNPGCFFDTVTTTCRAQLTSCDNLDETRCKFPNVTKTGCYISKAGGVSLCRAVQPICNKDVPKEECPKALDVGAVRDAPTGCYVNSKNECAPVLETCDKAPDATECANRDAFVGKAECYYYNDGCRSDKAANCGVLDRASCEAKGIGDDNPSIVVAGKAKKGCTYGTSSVGGEKCRTKVAACGDLDKKGGSNEEPCNADGISATGNGNCDWVKSWPGGKCKERVAAAKCEDILTPASKHACTKAGAVAAGSSCFYPGPGAATCRTVVANCADMNTGAGNLANCEIAGSAGDKECVLDKTTPDHKCIEKIAVKTTCADFTTDKDECIKVLAGALAADPEGCTWDPAGAGACIKAFASCAAVTDDTKCDIAGISKNPGEKKCEKDPANPGKCRVKPPVCADFTAAGVADPNACLTAAVGGNGCFFDTDSVCKDAALDCTAVVDPAKCGVVGIAKGQKCEVNPADTTKCRKIPECKDFAADRATCLAGAVGTNGCAWNATAGAAEPCVEAYADCANVVITGPAQATKCKFERIGGPEGKPCEYDAAAGNKCKVFVPPLANCNELNVKTAAECAAIGPGVIALGHRGCYRDNGTNSCEQRFPTCQAVVDAAKACNLPNASVTGACFTSSSGACLTVQNNCTTLGPDCANKNAVTLAHGCFVNSDNKCAPVVDECNQIVVAPATLSADCEKAAAVAPGKACFFIDGKCTGTKVVSCADLRTGASCGSFAKLVATPVPGGCTWVKSRYGDTEKCYEKKDCLPLNAEVDATLRREVCGAPNISLAGNSCYFTGGVCQPGVGSGCAALDEKTCQQNGVPNSFDILGTADAAAGCFYGDDGAGNMKCQAKVGACNVAWPKAQCNSAVLGDGSRCYFGNDGTGPAAQNCQARIGNCGLIDIPGAATPNLTERCNEAVTATGKGCYAGRRAGSLATECLDKVANCGSLVGADMGMCNSATTEAGKCFWGITKLSGGANVCNPRPDSCENLVSDETSCKAITKVNGETCDWRRKLGFFGCYNK